MIQKKKVYTKEESFSQNIGKRIRGTLTFEFNTRKIGRRC